LQAITKKLEFYGKIKVTSRPNKTYNQIDYINKEYIMAPMLLEEVERPPLTEVREYRSSRKKSPQLEDMRLKVS
ncbi:MAG: hypothetical protein ABUK08_07485, partial [Candidatus Humimicrobiaceae bacterium]